MIGIEIEIILKVQDKYGTHICQEIQEGEVIVRHAQGMIILKEIIDNNMNQIDIAAIIHHVI